MIVKSDESDPIRWSSITFVYAQCHSVSTQFLTLQKKWHPQCEQIEALDMQMISLQIMLCVILIYSPFKLCTLPILITSIHAPRALQILSLIPSHGESTIKNEIISICIWQYEHVIRQDSELIKVEISLSLSRLSVHPFQLGFRSECESVVCAMNLIASSTICWHCCPFYSTIILFFCSVFIFSNYYQVNLFANSMRSIPTCLFISPSIPFFPLSVLFCVVLSIFCFYMTLWQVIQL